MKKNIIIIALVLSLAFSLMLSGCTARRPIYTNDNGFDTTRNNIGYNDVNMGRQQGYGGTGANYGLNNNITNNRDYPGLPALPNDYGTPTNYGTNTTNNRLPNNRITNNNTLGNNNVNNMTNNNQGLERTCESVSGVKDATVVTTGNTAYVGIDSNNNIGTDLTRIKNEVANKIRSTNPNINVVYVSENNDFNNRLRSVGDRMKNGNKADGFMNELKEMVRNVVPQTVR